MNEDKKGTQLAKKLRQTAGDMEEEAETLRQLAYFGGYNSEPLHLSDYTCMSLTEFYTVAVIIACILFL